MRLRKILCPTDFSAGADEAMRAAVQLARETSAQLVIAHSWFVPPSVFPTEMLVPPEAIDQLRRDAEQGLAAAKREAEALGAHRVDTELLVGPAWGAIVDAAREHEIDLVVIGTHGRTGLSRVLLGSVAENVVRHAPCSVLVARPTSGESGRFQHILCPVDFSPASRAAADLAAELAARNHASLDLLHVIELPVAYSGELPVADMGRALDKRATELLERWCTELMTRAALSVTPVTRLGYPGAQTLSVIDHDTSIDLVVMGTHGRTGVPRVLLGSVAEKVVRHARCSVLVAHARA